MLLLTRPEEAAAAKVALAPLLSPLLPGFDVAGAEVRQARWDFAQLVDWYAYLRQQNLWRFGSGVRSGDKSEADNRIVLGVSDAGARARVAAELDALGVPCDLVLVKVMPPIRALFGG